MAENSAINTPTGGSETTTPKQIKFHYIKSNFFRVVHADGAIGSVSPGGDGLEVGFYSERMPIPLQEVFELTPLFIPGKKLDQTSREGVVREMEFQIVMNVTVAKAFSKWLQEMIPQLEKASADSRVLWERSEL